MAQRNVIRTLIVEAVSKPGNLGKITMAIGNEGGDIGDITIKQIGPLTTVRDITVHCESEEQLKRIVKAIERLGNGIYVRAVSDDILHAHEGGKIHMTSRLDLQSLTDLRKIYTPGVANVCRVIQEDPEKARYYTSIGNTVAIVTDGTAILGLGNIGPLAGMPVMEGKAALFDQLAGISGVPILLNTSDPDEVVETIKRISLGFGGILLEDIGSPHCFEIEERLVAELNIPVMHDDQHGTAVVTLAAAITASQYADISLENAVVGQIGLGAAGLAICRMFLSYGCKDVLGVDIRPDALERLERYGGTPVASVEELMSKADLVIATTGVPGLIRPEWIRSGQVILALSNPKPEIEPEAAIKAGAAFAADGRSVNNVLGFPGIFRGALNAQATRITQEMLIAAAEAIAQCVEPGELVPHPLDFRVHREVAHAVEEAARKGQA